MDVGESHVHRESAVGLGVGGIRFGCVGVSKSDAGGVVLAKTGVERHIMLHETARVEAGVRNTSHLKRYLSDAGDCVFHTAEINVRALVVH